MSRGRRRAVRRHPVRRAVVRTIAVLVGIAVVLAVVAAGFVGQLVRTFEDRAVTIPHAFPAGQRPAAGADGAVNVLLIGSDSRAELDPDGDDARGQRADTLMLVHVPADHRGVFVMSIMRDSWVQVPGHGQAKINAAYSWGGVPLTVQTVEQLLDVRIDHVAEIGFAGLQGMTDALGGVDVHVDRPFTARGHRFTAGQDHLDGAAALAFVRERHAFADADHQRVRNQQAFLRGLLEGVLSRGTLTSPGRISDLVGATTSYLSVDAGLTPTVAARLGWDLRHLRPADLHTFTMPTAGGGTSADGQSYVAVNDIALPALRQALRSDTMAGWLAADGG